VHVRGETGGNHYSSNGSQIAGLHEFDMHATCQHMTLKANYLKDVCLDLGK